MPFSISNINRCKQDYLVPCEYYSISKYSLFFERFSNLSLKMMTKISQDVLNNSVPQLDLMTFCCFALFLMHILNDSFLELLLNNFQNNSIKLCRVKFLVFQ